MVWRNVIIKPECQASSPAGSTSVTKPMSPVTISGLLQPMIMYLINDLQQQTNTECVVATMANGVFSTKMCGVIKPTGRDPINQYSLFFAICRA